MFCLVIENSVFLLPLCYTLYKLYLFFKNNIYLFPTESSPRIRSEAVTFECHGGAVVPYTTADQEDSDSFPGSGQTELWIFFTRNS